MCVSPSEKKRQTYRSGDSRTPALWACVKEGYASTFFRSKFQRPFTPRISPRNPMNWRKFVARSANSIKLKLDMHIDWFLIDYIYPNQKLLVSSCSPFTYLRKCKNSRNKIFFLSSYKNCYIGYSFSVFILIVFLSESGEKKRFKVTNECITWFRKILT